MPGKCKSDEICERGNGWGYMQRSYCRAATCRDLMCADDEVCIEEQAKCYRWGNCPTVGKCVTKESLCDEASCQTQETCEIITPRCYRYPCNPIAVCQKDPCEDKECSDDEFCKICVGPPCDGTPVCVAKASLCAAVTCPDGQECKVIQPRCYRPPCHPKAICQKTDPCEGNCEADEICEGGNGWGYMKRPYCRAATCRDLTCTDAEVCIEEQVQCYRWGGCPTVGKCVTKQSMCDIHAK
ncbi:uncharacterized protein LOC141903352 [Tubulanus polymorphus]|uniref:uncharacterized protein LOC141903352 n=1 Tax=Tubulanus polymorphus TaxID=672921 RepID=UPI003DA673F2